MKISKMDVLSRVKRKFNYLLDNRYIDKQQQELLLKILNSVGKTIYLFCVPVHSNLGDQAQYFCWLRLFKQFCPDYNIISIPTINGTEEILDAIKKTSTEQDVFLIHSGYLIYDPHPELPFICKVIDNFHDHQITILPQTINLISEKKKKEVGDCFNSHPDLTIISRDEVSLQKAHILFHNCTRLLRPDVVTTLIGDPDFQYNPSKRNGILFCIRNDGEKFYTEEQIESLKHRFKGIKAIETDTTIVLPKRYWDDKREELIRKIIAFFAQFQLIITDRYHGTIFSQVANTPVIVLNSADHKLTSGFKWFPKKIFGDNVFFAKNLDEAYTLAKKILARNGKVINNPPYFKNEFYSKN